MKKLNKKHKILILGKSNVGKSSLVNYLKKKHSTLVSNKLHATRISTMHDYKINDLDIELIDTPGVSITDTHLLSKAMKSHASRHILYSDLIVLITQPQKNYDYELDLIKEIEECDKKYLICLNKIDLDHKREFKEKLPNKIRDENIYEISIKDETGVDNLLIEFEKYLGRKKISPYMDYNTQNEKNILQELIRESIINITNQEVPYESAVCIKEIQSDKNKDIIRADIIVTKENHKKIIIGKNGNMIKKIGIISREKIENYLNKKIHLSLFVVVKENWKNSSELLKELGYID